MNAAASSLPSRELILVCGMPGAGKSHYVETLLSRGDHTLLSLDRTFETMRRTSPGMTDDEIAATRWEEAMILLRTALDEAVARGDNIIYEATNLTPAARKERIDAANACQAYTYQVHAVFVHPPEGQENIDRLVHRGLRERRMGAIEKIDRYYQELVMPTPAEGFTSITEIGTTPATRAFEEYRTPASFRLTDIMPDGTITPDAARKR